MLLLVFALTAVISFFEGGRIMAGFVLAAVIAIIEAVLLVVHYRQPERTPVAEVIEGRASYDPEPEEWQSRWSVGDTPVHLPPHWYARMQEGEHLRVRVARPPGETLALALAIEGKCSADFERARGLPVAPAKHPVLSLVFISAALVVGVAAVIGGSTAAFGDATLDQALPTLHAVAEGEVRATTADVEQHGLPRCGILIVEDATVLPRTLVVDAPPDATWALLSTRGRARLTALREAKAGRRIGQIPKPDERSDPVTLDANDVIAWRSADDHETLGPTGRPGDQMLVWLSRSKPFELVVLDHANARAVLSDRDDAENLAFATACVLLGFAALPVFLLTLASIAHRRTSASRFADQAQSVYMSV